MTDTLRFLVFFFGWMIWAVLVCTGIGWVVWVSHEDPLLSIGAVVEGLALCGVGFGVGYRWLDD